MTQTSVKCYLNDELLFETAPPTGPVTASITKDYETNDLIMKLVNSSANAIDASVNIAGMEGSESASVTVLTGAPDARNSIEVPNAVVPVVSTISVSNNFGYQLPAYSMNVIRFKMGIKMMVETPYMDKDEQLNQLEITPNPSVNYAHISLKNRANINSVELYNLNGNLIRQYSHITGNSLVIERGNLPGGVYIIKVTGENYSTAGKIIFENNI